MKPVIDRPSVLVLHEKYGEIYFFVPNEETLFSTALEIVKARYNSGRYYSEPVHPGPAPITKEQIESLPDVMKDDGRKKLTAYVRELKFHRREKEMWDEFLEALKEEDGRAAWQFLYERGAYEYERVSIEKILGPGEYRA